VAPSSIGVSSEETNTSHPLTRFKADIWEGKLRMVLVLGPSLGHNRL